MRTDGTEYQTEIRSLVSHCVIEIGNVAVPSGSTVMQAAARQVAKTSNTDRSKLSGAGLQTRSSSVSPAADAAHSTNASELRWEIITPFGVPVDPEVYKMYARSVSIARSSVNGSPGSAATSVHGTIAASSARPTAGSPPGRFPGELVSTTPPRGPQALPTKAIALGVLTSSAMITAMPLSPAT